MLEAVRWRASSEGKESTFGGDEDEEVSAAHLEVLAKLRHDALWALMPAALNEHIIAQALDIIL